MQIESMFSGRNRSWHPVWVYRSLFPRCPWFWESLCSRLRLWRCLFSCLGNRRCVAKVPVPQIGWRWYGYSCDWTNNPVFYADPRLPSRPVSNPVSDGASMNWAGYCLCRYTRLPPQGAGTAGAKRRRNSFWPVDRRTGRTGVESALGGFAAAALGAAPPATARAAVAGAATVRSGFAPRAKQWGQIRCDFGGTAVAHFRNRMGRFLNDHVKPDVASADREAGRVSTSGSLAVSSSCNITPTEKISARVPTAWGGRGLPARYSGEFRRSSRRRKRCVRSDGPTRSHRFSGVLAGRAGYC